MAHDEARRATRRLRQCRDIQSAWKLLKALPLSRLRLNDFHVGAFCGAAAQLKAWQEAYEAISAMGHRTLPPDLIARNAALASLPDWRACINSCHQGATDHISTNSCISSFSKGWNWKGSLHLLAAMPTLRHQRDAYGFSSAIDATSTSDLPNGWRISWSLLHSTEADEFALASAAKMPRASWYKSLQLLTSIELYHLRASEVMYGSVISSFESASCWDRACEVLGIAASRRLASLISCSSSLSSGEKAAQWHQPMQIFSQMSELMFQPDEICFGAMVSACDKGGQWDVALRFLSASCFARLADDVITWNSAISACERRRRWPQALALLRRSPRRANHVGHDVGHDALLQGVTAACSACGKGGLWERALSLTAGTQADPVILNTLLFACVRGLALTEAVRLASAEASYDLVLAVYETLQDAPSSLQLLQALRCSVLEDYRARYDMASKP